MVFYRTYRPQTIAELDNETVRNTLYSVLSTDNPPHAFLFTGPKGLGKTSSARIVAKVLNCERQKSEDRRQRTENRSQKTDNKQSSSPSSVLSSPSSVLRHPSSDIEPCNTCDMCVSITEGSNVDVLEIDAASNRGIDEMRDLREKIRLAPVSARRKVYIIDEVHMLTTEAFNALLKTLEEPPAHAVFMLATTQPEKVPATIHSRCLHIAFTKATDEELLRSFKRIATGEKLSVDRETLLTIAKLADGGFRDGAKILEELSLLSDNKTITKELVEEKYQVKTSAKFVDDIVSCFETKDAKQGLQLIGQMVRHGVDMRLFVGQLIEKFHELLLQKLGVQASSEKSQLTVSDIQIIFQLLSKAHQDVKYAILPQLPLELALIQWSTDEHYDNTYYRSDISKEEKGAADVTDGVDLHSLRRKVGELHKKQALVAEKPVVKKQSSNTDPSSSSLLSYNGTGEPTKEWLADFWRSFIITTKAYNHTVSGVLRGCHMKHFDRTSLIIETSYKFHKDKLSEAKTIEALEQAAKTLTGNSMKVAIELKK